MGTYRTAYWESPMAGLGMPRRHQRSGRYAPYPPDPLVGQDLTVSARARAELGEAERLCAALEASLTTRGESGRAPMAMLRVIEGIGSSAMEGYRSAAARLVASITTGGAGAKGSDMKIVGNLAALDEALSLADRDVITPHDLVTIQSHLMNEPRETSLVGLRDEQNWVGGADYHPLDASHVPPPPHEVDALIEDLCQYVSTPSEDSPLMRAALAHAQFETIHPFLDGNGRTGRTLIHLMLRRDGLLDNVVLPLSTTWGRDRSRYIEYLHALRTDGPWDMDVRDQTASYIAATAIDAASRAFDISARVSEIEAELRETTAANFRADSIAHAIAGDICASLGVTSDGIAAAHGTSSVAALRALERMEGLGLISRRSVQRPHVFYVPRLVELIERVASHVADEQPSPGSVPDVLSVATAAADAKRTSPKPTRCGVWMPRSKTPCALPAGHPGWPTQGHRSAPH